MSEKLYGGILHDFFGISLHFKTSLHLLQLLRRMLQHCFAVKLQKYFTDYKTKPD